MQFLVFTARADFDAVNATMNAAFGYPTEDQRTLRYAEPLLHPSNGQMAMPIEERCLPYLTAEQTAALKNRDDLAALGWFPAPAETDAL